MRVEILSNTNKRRPTASRTLANTIAPLFPKVNLRSADDRRVPYLVNNHVDSCTARLRYTLGQAKKVSNGVYQANRIHVDRLISAINALRNMENKPSDYYGRLSAFLDRAELLSKSIDGMIAN